MGVWLVVGQHVRTRNNDPDKDSFLKRMKSRKPQQTSPSRHQDIVMGSVAP